MTPARRLLEERLTQAFDNPRGQPGNTVPNLETAEVLSVDSDGWIAGVLFAFRDLQQRPWRSVVGLERVGNGWRAIRSDGGTVADETRPDFSGAGEFLLQHQSGEDFIGLSEDPTPDELEGVERGGHAVYVATTEVSHLLITGQLGTRRAEVSPHGFVIVVWRGARPHVSVRDFDGDELVGGTLPIHRSQPLGRRDGDTGFRVRGQNRPLTVSDSGPDGGVARVRRRATHL